MNKISLSWIIMTMIILEAVSSHALFNNRRGSSQVPALLKKLIDNYPIIPKANAILPDYQDHPPTPLSNFQNYDWNYVNHEPKSRLASLRKRKRSAPARNSGARTLCARTKTGRCIARCGFGAPLDKISQNRFFGCKRIRVSKYLRI